MRRLLLFLICCSADAHVVSMSSGELHVNGRSFDSAWQQAMQEIQSKSKS